MIINDVIKVSINDKQEQIVSARDLHRQLGINKRFTDWFKYQAEKLCLNEGNGFIPILGETSDIGGRPSIDYQITLEIAKHLSMISGGERAYRIRQYFIEVENVWNSPEQIMARALKLSNKKIDEYKVRLEGVEQFQKQIAASQNSLLVREVAKLASSKGMQIGEHRLWQKLRGWGLIIQGKTEPYQRYIDRGYFEVTEGIRESSSGILTFWTTRVTGRGQIYIIKRLVEESLKASFEEA
jgi:anti-repressor protein